jgi:hypothetical protein
MKKIFNEGNQIHNFVSSSGSGTVINYGSGSGSDFLTSYGSGPGSTSQKVTVPTVPVPVPVPQHCGRPEFESRLGTPWRPSIERRAMRKQDWTLSEWMYE